MKYRELLNNITEVAKKHPNINSTFIGDVYELNHRNDVDYCAFVITQGTHRVNSDDETIDYTLNLFYVDRLTADEGNRTQIHSSGIDFMNSLLRAVEKLGVTVVEHTENVFNERFNDVCAGVYAGVVFRCDIDECGQTIEIISYNDLKTIRIDHNVTSKSITANGVYNSEGDDVWNSVDVAVPERQPVLDTLNVVENGTYNAPSAIDGYNTVTVNVQSGGGTADYSDMQFKIDLTELDTAKYNSVQWTDLSYKFDRCTKLTSLDLSGWDTSKVTDMNSMFYYCSSLTSLDLSSFNTGKVTNMNNMFYLCSSLETINCDGLKLPNINLSDIHLDSATKLTVDSIVGLLNALPQSTNNYSFQIGADNIAKLSDMQKQIATDKGWKLI